MSDAGMGGSLDGDLVTIPFTSTDYLSNVRSSYEELSDAYGTDRVLVLNRYPAGTRELEDALANEVQTVERPRVDVLSNHARRVIEEQESVPTVIDRAERTAVIRDFLDQYAWEEPYLQAAAEKDGFRADFARFVVAASYQQRPDTVDDPVLAELYDAVAAYHSFCRTRYEHPESSPGGFIDQANVLVRAIELLQDDSIRARVRGDYDAVLALEFEEYDATSRTYLQLLSGDCELTAVAHADSAVRRPFSEAGRIEDAVPTMEQQSTGPHTVQNPLQAIVSFLGTGDAPRTDLAAVSRHLGAPTFREHVKAIGREIEALTRNGFAYDQIAVVLRDSNAPIAETNDILRAQGLPTTSATVRGLEHDPTARELLAVARWLAAATCDADVDQEAAYATLTARVARQHPTGREESAAEVVDRALEAATEAPDTEAGFWRWVVRSGLKQRVATLSEPIEARIRFSHVKQLASVVEFLNHDRIEADWERVVTEFEELLEFESVDRVSEDLDTVDGAVRVEAARTVKTLEFDIVFLAGVVEAEYPNDPEFGSLFSRPQLRRFDTYPTVTSPTTAAVRETFAPATAEGAGREAKDSLDAYYEEIARRMLAVGARAAREAVYFCTYQQERGLGQRRRPSRFLVELEEHFGQLEELETGATADDDPRAFAVSRLEQAIDTVRQARLRGDTVDIAALEREFGAVQAILDDLDDETLGRAVEARADLARGRVRRD